MGCGREPQLVVTFEDGNLQFLPALELAATWHCRSFMAPLFSFVLRL